MTRDFALGLGAGLVVGGALGLVSVLLVRRDAQRQIDAHLARLSAGARRDPREGR